MHCDGQLHNPNTGGNRGFIEGNSPQELALGYLRQHVWNPITRAFEPVIRITNAIGRGVYVYVDWGVGAQVEVGGVSLGANKGETIAYNLGSGRVEREVRGSYGGLPVSVRSAACDDTGEIRHQASVLGFHRDHNNDVILSGGVSAYVPIGGGIGITINFSEIGRRARAQ